MSDRYFIDDGSGEREVTRAEFCSWEQRCGFRSKFGPSHPATAGFSSTQGRSHIKGRVQYDTSADR